MDCILEWVLSGAVMISNECQKGGLLMYVIFVYSNYNLIDSQL